MLREDSICFSLFECVQLNALSSLFQKPKMEAYVADKIAWLLSALIGNSPGMFAESNVTYLLSFLQPVNSVTYLPTPCTDLGVLEAITNLLKSDTYRELVWPTTGVPERIFKLDPRTDSSAGLYRSVFALWMLSFDDK